jgi:acyl-CoA hydrolase
MLKETIISHLVKPEDLQHHGTLFAGRMAEWLVEACFIAACRLVGRPEDVVCVQVYGINFTNPIHNGDVVEIRSRVARVGKTSITVHGRAYIPGVTEPSVTGMATFVTLDKQGRPYEHGFSLPESYIAEHRDIYEEACRAMCGS